MAGITAYNRFQTPTVNDPLRSPLTNQYKLYNTGVAQNAQDYGNIMQGYQNVLSQSQLQPKLNFQSFQPQTYQYTPSTNVTNSLNNLSNLSQTGGYSSSDIANIRSRGISPIRSIYSSANRDIDRNRAIQGGYSPNYAAVKAKMARELSDIIANKSTDIEAGIAENIARNKLSVSPTYSNASQAESALRNQYGARNADVMNEAAKFNIETPLQYGRYNQGINDTGLRALQGMQGLYGTTPALSSLYGGQALSAAQLQNLINQQERQGNLQIIGQLMGGLR